MFRVRSLQLSPQRQSHYFILLLCICFYLLITVWRKRSAKGVTLSLDIPCNHGHVYRVEWHGCLFAYDKNPNLTEVTKAQTEYKPQGSKKALITMQLNSLVNSQKKLKIHCVCPVATSILTAMNVAPYKRNWTGKAFLELQSHSSALLNFNAHWKELQDHFNELQKLMKKRFEELALKTKEDEKEKKIRYRKDHCIP